MKTQTANTCPGCSRHCPAKHLRCKYGQKHFEKLRRAEEAKSLIVQAEKKPRHKWEKHVTPDGLFWHLLWYSGRIKRALRKKKISEQQLLSTLTQQEQAQLDALLEKVTKILES